VPIVLWTVAAILVAVAGVSLAMRIGVKREPPPPLPPGERMPFTALQRLAAWSLLFGGLPAVAAGALLVHFGAMRFWDDDRVRLPITALLVASVLAFGAVAILMHALAARDDGSVDERDRAILGRASTAQSVATLLTLAVWVVALTHTYHATHLVPSVHLYLLFWSCLIANIAALPVGILLGYPRG
jgi:hypothetical protein